MLFRTANGVQISDAIVYPVKASDAQSKTVQDFIKKLVLLVSQ